MTYDGPMKFQFKTVLDMRTSDLRISPQASGEVTFTTQRWGHNDLKLGINSDNYTQAGMIFMYAPCQWETTLQCNVFSHWLGEYIWWSLLRWHYNVVQYMIIHTALQWQELNINQSLNSQRHLHILPSRASYGVSVAVSKFRKNINSQVSEASKFWA